MSFRRPPNIPAQGREKSQQAEDAKLIDAVYQTAPEAARPKSRQNSSQRSRRFVRSFPASRQTMGAETGGPARDIRARVLAAATAAATAVADEGNPETRTTVAERSTPAWGQRLQRLKTLLKTPWVWPAGVATAAAATVLIVGSSQNMQSRKMPDARRRAWARQPQPPNVTNRLNAPNPGRRFWQPASRKSLQNIPAACRPTGHYTSQGRSRARS